MSVELALVLKLARFPHQNGLGCRITKTDSLLTKYILGLSPTSNHNPRSSRDRVCFIDFNWCYLTLYDT